MPNLNRILRDLKRPIARDAARAALAARISEPDTLAWATQLVDAGRVWRLALAARPGVSDADVVSAWRAEAKADRAAAEAEAAAALRAKIAAANVVEDAVDGGDGLRPLGV